MDMTTTLKNALLNNTLRNTNYVPPATVHLALFTSATTDAGGGTEVTGGSYARQLLTFVAPTDGVSSNTAAVSYTNMPAVTVTHAAIMSAATGGTMLLHGPLVAPKTIAAGDSVTIAIGDVDVVFS